MEMRIEFLADRVDFLQIALCECGLQLPERELDSLANVSGGASFTARMLKRAATAPGFAKDSIANLYALNSFLRAAASFPSRFPEQELASW